ncbi:hypothetical protein Acr_11g0011800 [Actinidia rufa]|uniref:Transposase MuDR plant domain-containing protein n=1 Tax=Actinidia rufa TaxID=165716 RepID=A0A7J0FDU5_9ERIC|nr:hypothetical protein Acr_11g0011800 [Actinidia rufa]
MCYDVELGTSVAQLHDMIIPMVTEYGEHMSIKFICRYPHRRNGDVMIYKKLSTNDDKILQNILNIPSRHLDHQHVEIYVVKEEGSTMNTSGSHATVKYPKHISRGSTEATNVLPLQPTFDNSDENIDVLLTNEANDDFDDDGHEDPNIGEALHDNPHIPFFMNLVRADDVIGGRDLYDGCPTWSDTTLEFAKGMVFKDNDAVIRACNWYHVKKNKHYHVVEINKNVWSTRCSHDCPWKLRACLKKQHGFFEIKQYPEPHICVHGKESLDHRNINSTFITHLIKTQVAEDPGWKIASIIENVKKNSSFYYFLQESMAWMNKGIEVVILISDWHAAIISAVKHEWETARLGQPIGIYRYCLRHFRSNYQKNFGNVKVKDLIWKAGTAHQVRKFDEAMDEIKKLGTNSESTARAYHTLCNEDPRKWTLAHDGGYRWGVTTTNDSECYNNVLKGARDLPITSCVEVTFYRLVAFGVIPPTEEIDSGRLRMSWLHRTFDVLPEHADDVSVQQQHARAYIFRLIGDQVCRQFRLRQVVPAAPNTSPALYGIDMRGMTSTDWTQFHREHIDRWHHRHKYLVVGVIDAAVMRYDDPYMV